MRGFFEGMTPDMFNRWTKVRDCDIIHVYECHNLCNPLDGRAEVDPTFFQEAGTPICGECGEDMEYMHTLIRDINYVPLSKD